MNLTSRVHEARIRRAWRSSIAPAAEQLRARGVEVMTPPADDAESWYTDASQEPHFVEVTGVEADLTKMWERDGLPELAAASKDIAKLVELFRDHGPQKSNVSSDVYAMY